MPFAAALSTATDTSRAADEVCDLVGPRLTGTADLAFAFFSPHHLAEAGAVAKTLHARFGPRALLGCVGETVIGNDREEEDGPALSLWLGQWGNKIEVLPFSLERELTPEGPALLGWPDELSVAKPDRSAVLLLGDPFTFPADVFLRRMNDEHDGVRVMGGMASGVRGPGECRLILGNRVLDRGAVGVLLTGPLGLRPIVSQGCRPVGKHFVVTRAQDNVILELGGKAPLQQLQELWPTLSPAEQQLFQQGPHLGQVINEYQGEFQRGDFLVRNILGLEKKSGALIVNDRVRVGQTVQFHVRDAATADEDLHSLLQLDISAHDRRPAGALLFSCNGRGTRLFSESHHDARAVRAEAGEIPVAGFFAQGELGPVGGQNFIHGFTASIALFEE